MNKIEKATENIKILSQKELESVSDFTANIRKLLEKSNNSRYELSKNLYEGKKILKSKEQKVKSWYKELGISEDKASELLRLYCLYLKVEEADISAVDKIERKAYLGKISIQIAMLLARKENDHEIVLNIIKSQVTDYHQILELLGLLKHDKPVILALATSLGKALKKSCSQEIVIIVRQIEDEIEKIKKIHILEVDKND